MLVHHDLKVLNFPYPVDYGEGPVLDQAMRLSRFENIYRADVSRPPYQIANYPPVFMFAQVPFAWLAGPALWYGRLISFIGILVAAATIGMTIHALTKDWLAGIFSGGLLLCFPYVLHWGSLNRVDSLALALCCGGMYAIVRQPESRAHRIGAAALLVMAAYTRQSYALAAPFAVFVFLSHEHPWKKTFEFVAWAAGMGVVIFIALHLWSRGGFFFHIVTSNINPFHWEPVKIHAQEIGRHIPLFVAASALFLLSGAWGRSKEWWLIAPFLTGALVEAMTIGKVGSNVNYLFELCAAISLATGAVIAWSRRMGHRLHIALSLALMVQTFALVQWSKEAWYPRHAARILLKRQLESINEYVRLAPPGPVLADEYLGMLTTNGRPLYYQPFEFKMLALGKVWDQGPILEDIRGRKFPLILLYDPPAWPSRHERWTRQQLDTIEENYSRVDYQGEVSVYTPRTGGIY